MPITLTPIGPTGAIGPGLYLQGHSDFIGPLPTGTVWLYSIYSDQAGELLYSTIRHPSQNNPDVVLVLSKTDQFQTTTVLQPAPKEGQNVQVTAQLETSSGVIDSGSQSIPWSTTDGLGNQVRIQTGATTGGGLTDEQALQLSQTQASTFPTQLLDNVTLQPLSDGPTEGPVNANLLRFSFGVIVRIASVPDDLVPGTPDGDYWFESLAIVRVFRGADLWIRVPVHTSSKIVNFVEQNVVAGLAQVTGTLWLLNMTVQVTFREGVTGEVFNMIFP